MSCEYCFGMSKTDLLINKNIEVSRDDALNFNNVLERLSKGEPIQYVLNQADFYGLKFKVNKHVLIPRQETEELVDLIIKKHQDRNLKILDIGTGSGVIPVTLKKHLPNANVQAIDVSSDALILAKENALKQEVEVLFLESDILNKDYWDKLEKYDIIISNPPYVLNSEKDLMHQNVLNFEPHLALFVEDENPLLFYKKITHLAKQKLKKGGSLYFEINEQFGQETKQLLIKNNFIKVQVVKDINGKDRIVYGIKE